MIKHVISEFRQEGSFIFAAGWSSQNHPRRYIYAQLVEKKKMLLRLNASSLLYICIIYCAYVLLLVHYHHLYAPCPCSLHPPECNAMVACSFQYRYVYNNLYAENIFIYISPFFSEILVYFCVLVFITRVPLMHNTTLVNTTKVLTRARTFWDWEIRVHAAGVWLGPVLVW